MLLSRVIRTGARQHVLLRHASTLSSQQTAEKPQATILSTDKLEATVENKTGICRLVMRNAPVNVLEKDLLMGMRDVVMEADKSPNIRALVLASGFPNMFSAGLDVSVLANVDVDEQNFREYWATYHELIMMLYMLKGVTVAAIDGMSVAGSLVMALACDYRIITQGKHQLGLIETKVGVDVPFFASELFKNQCGSFESMVALPHGKLYDVPSAHRVGLVEEVCPAGELDNAVNNFLANTLRISTEAYHMTKVHVRKTSYAAMIDSLAEDMEQHVALLKKPETKKRILAYVSASAKSNAKKDKN